MVRRRRFSVICTARSWPHAALRTPSTSAKSNRLGRLRNRCCDERCRGYCSPRAGRALPDPTFPASEWVVRRSGMAVQPPFSRGRGCRSASEGHREAGHRHSQNPLALALWDSHILRFEGECEAFSYCCEALPTIAHGFGAWGFIITVPAAQPGDGPTDPGQRAGRMGVALAVGLALQTEAQRGRGGDLLGTSLAGRELPSRASTS